MTIEVTEFFFLSSEKSFLNSWPVPGVYSNYVSTSIEFRAQQLAPNQPGGIFNKNKRIHPALLVYRGLFVQHNTLKTPSGSSFDHIINDLQSVVPRVIPAAKVFCRFPIIDRSNNSTRCFTNIFSFSLFIFSPVRNPKCTLILFSLKQLFKKKERIFGKCN